MDWTRLQCVIVHCFGQQELPDGENWSFKCLELHESRGMG